MKPEGAFLKGLTMSIPHTANGQVMGIVLSAELGTWVWLAYFWPDAPLDNVGSVCVCGEPVEAVSHSLCDQRAGAGVVTAVAGVNVLEDFASFSGLNAALEHAGHAALVELAVDDDEGFAATCYHPVVRLVCWQGASLQVGNVRLGPVVWLSDECD